MRVVPPLALTLSATNAAESTYDAWNVATAYSPGDKVYYNPTSALVYHEYESLTSHTGVTPTIGGGINWLDTGPANARAMFDERTSTQTLVDEELEVTVIPGAFFDTIALINISGASSAQIVIVNDGVTLYDQTFDTTGNAEDWDQYFFGEDEDNLAALVVNPAIFYASCTVTVTLTGAPGADAGLGLLLIGRSRFIGETLYSPKLGIEDFSTKETDAFGNTYLLERPYADTVTAQLTLDTSRVDSVRRELARYRATPVLFDLNNTGVKYDSLLVFGFFESFEITLAFYTMSYCDLRVQSLI